MWRLLACARKVIKGGQQCVRQNRHATQATDAELLFVYLLQYLWHSIYAVAIWPVINRSRLITADDRHSYILSRIPLSGNEFSYKIHKSKKPVI